MLPQRTCLCDRSWRVTCLVKKYKNCTPLFGNSNNRKIADLLATSDHPSPTAHRRLFESLLSNLVYTLASNFSYTFDPEYIEMSSQRMHHPFRPFRSSSLHISIYTHPWPFKTRTAWRYHRKRVHFVGFIHNKG